jgi:hypothetical protein
MKKASGSSKGKFLLVFLILSLVLLINGIQSSSDDFIIVSKLGNQTAGVQVNCPSGYTVTGGGFTDKYFEEDDQDASYPVGNGWYCQEDKSNPQSECYAVCVSSELVSTNIIVKTGNQKSGVQASCGASTLLGGGWGLEGISDDDQDESRPTGNSWYCLDDVSFDGATCYAVCGNAKEDYTMSCETKSVTGSFEDGSSVMCSQGYEVVGGGFKDASGNSDDQDYNHPIAGGWYCEEDSSSSNSVCYARCCSFQPKDNDKDGYNSTVDCDDNDASVWQILIGFTDADYDGYGAGPALGLCAGRSINGGGYSCNNQDCNDSNFYVSPFETENCLTPYDDNCNGQTNEGCTINNDKDGDGYNTTFDCNDNNASIHPGALDICGNGIDEDCSGADAICPQNDTTAPSTITNLTATNIGDTWIYWTWNNPSDADFKEVLIYLGSENKLNTSVNYFNATGLSKDTSYTITLYTEDNSSNINWTAVSNTAKTLAGKTDDDDSDDCDDKDSLDDSEKTVIYFSNKTTLSQGSIFVNGSGPIILKSQPKEEIDWVPLLAVIMFLLILFLLFLVFRAI